MESGSGETGLQYRADGMSATPREKLAESGAGALSDCELLAVILGHGIRGRDVRALARDALAIIERGGNDILAIRALPGFGAAKAAALAAALELGRRIYVPADRKILTPRDVVPLIAHFADRQQERFICLSLNGAHEVMAVRVVSVGTVNRAIVHPREIFADPITDRASAIVVAHNHPSGNLEPSIEDRDITTRLQKAGDTLGIELLDHLIFGLKGYYSFLEHGGL